MEESPHSPTRCFHHPKDCRQRRTGWSVPATRHSPRPASRWKPSAPCWRQASSLCPPFANTMSNDPGATGRCVCGPRSIRQTSQNRQAAPSAHLYAKKHTSRGRSLIFHDCLFHARAPRRPAVKFSDSHLALPLPAPIGREGCASGRIGHCGTLPIRPPRTNPALPAP